MAWDRELENGLPDSRLAGSRRRATTVSLRGQLMERVYCANCGADGGLITAEWSPHVFFICDGCVGTRGEPPLLKADEASVRGRDDALKT